MEVGGNERWWLVAMRMGGDGPWQWQLLETTCSTSPGEGIWRSLAFLERKGGRREREREVM